MLSKSGMSNPSEKATDIQSGTILDGRVSRALEALACEFAGAATREAIPQVRQIVSGSTPVAATSISPSWPSLPRSNGSGWKAYEGSEERKPSGLRCTNTVKYRTKQSPGLASEAMRRRESPSRTPDLKSTSTVASPYRGKSRASGLKTRNDRRRRAALVRASRAVSALMMPDSEWRDFGVFPDLKGVAVQAADRPPINLVPPIDFDSRTWSDTTYRCIRVAELVADGHPRPKTLDEFRAIEEGIRAQEREKQEATRLLRLKNDPPEVKWPEFGPTQVRRVRQASAYMQSLMGRLGFFTGTLNPEALKRLAICSNGWGRATSVFRKHVRQLCKRRGLKCLQLDVTEIQMDRYRSCGEPAPHLHMVLVVRNKTGSGSPWLISGADLQRLWDAAINSVVGGEPVATMNRTELVPVKKDVFGYLRKYFSKGSESDDISWTGWEGVRPRQGCSQSGELKAAVEAMTTRHSGVFMSWLELNAERFRGRGFYHLKTYSPDDIPVGNIAEVQFYSPEAELCVFIRFLKDLRKNIAGLRGLANEEFDPVSALGLPVPAADLEAQLPRTLPIGGPGPVTQDLRKRLDILFLNSQIAEPVFPVAVNVPKNEGAETQLSLFPLVNRLSSDGQLGPPGSD